MMATLYTIGYEATDIARFVDEVRRQGIARIIDVRRNPISPKRGFAKGALAARLTAEGIGYTHLVDLDPPKDLRDVYRVERDLARYFTRFATYLVGQQEALTSVTELAHAERCALLCFERDPVTCHRSVIAAHLTQHAAIWAEHLFVPLTASPASANVWALAD